MQINIHIYFKIIISRLFNVWYNIYFKINNTNGIIFNIFTKNSKK